MFFEEEGNTGGQAMARRQSKQQKETIGRVMHEYKQGELDTRRGKKVRNPKQAIAIALHEAGASNQESPKKNRENLARTKSRERRGATEKERSEGTSSGSDKNRSELYAEAKRRNIRGRSKMDKAELQRALQA
jgi:hypothetical protein